MPHQCTECGHTFEDGSKEMLSGCPECGGNKFQFLPDGAESDAKPETSDEPRADPSAADDREDRAQADARSSVVDADELPSSEPDAGSEPDEATSDLSELREELNDQFESIRIVDHGQYELNLMELYKREEFIIALQENGRYVIEVPESFRRGLED
ncbi:Zn-ribbon domain-containing protein [Halalkalicoccus subterraneus]|uniref:Zn-ribbon domain-containing protein n=1 Tax=Halalkalicoccus subterraneus TaxID=2675002 RepID=UPI000EFD50EB|nr:Zn-ribbon domain-containing protein [Halalkalicoccus subterraneus]